MKFKNDAQRRSFLLKKNLKFQKDDKGVEGVCVPKNGNGDDEKEIKVGKRLSSSKIRQEDYGDGSEFSKDQLQAAKAKNSAGLAVQAVSQDWLFGLGLGLEMGQHYVAGSSNDFILQYTIIILMINDMMITVVISIS